MPSTSASVLTDDLGWRLWRDGYRALAAERARAGGADTFAGRLLGRRSVVTRGRTGVRTFYDTDTIQRRGAVPPPLAELLFGHGPVHGLDGQPHRDRKAMFLDILGEESVADLAATIGAGLRTRLHAQRGREVALFDELVDAYGVAVLRWAGVDCSEPQARRVARRLAAIVDGFGFAGSAYVRGWAARLWCDAWARRVVREARDGTRVPPRRSPLLRIAASDLSVPVAAVELGNLVRPTVAVAWLGTFAALALAEHPQWRDRLRGDGADPRGRRGPDNTGQGGIGSAERRIAFGHEVRRYYPFVPALAGRVRRASEIHGVPLRAGDRLILDVVGTNRDPSLWDRPEEFLPERFAGVEPDPFGFVPQGGGDPRTGHRCPGEPLTVRILAETLGVLAEMEYDVVSAASYDATRIPTRPDRGLVVRLR